MDDNYSPLGGQDELWRKGHENNVQEASMRRLTLRETHYYTATCAWFPFLFLSPSFSPHLSLISLLLSYPLSLPLSRPFVELIDVNQSADQSIYKNNQMNSTRNAIQENNPGNIALPEQVNIVEILLPQRPITLCCCPNVVIGI